MTMNASAPAAPAAATPAAPAAPASPAPAARSTTASRAAALKASLADAPLESAVEDSGSSSPPDRPASAADSSGAAPATPANDDGARARERLARIEQVRAKERADEQERLQRKQGKERETEFEKLRKQVAELEPLNSVFASEEALLVEAEKRGLSSEKLVQWMRTRLTDPTAVAQKQAQSVEEKLRAEMKALQDRIDKTEADRKAEQEQAEQSRAADAKTSAFFGQVKERATSHPLTAALQAKFGDGGLVGFANQFIAPLLPEGYSLDELHDHTEQLLDELQFARGNIASAPPASGSSHPQSKNGAAEPATTLSNALAAGRESLTEEVPLHQLSRAERKRRLREKLDREPTP